MGEWRERATADGCGWLGPAGVEQSVQLAVGWSGVIYPWILCTCLLLLFAPSKIVRDVGAPAAKSKRALTLRRLCFIFVFTSTFTSTSETSASATYVSLIVKRADLSSRISILVSYLQPDPQLRRCREAAMTATNIFNQSMQSYVQYASFFMQHPEDLSEADNNRLLESGDYSDLKITCNGHEWKVHKALVYSKSEFFRAAVRFPGRVS